MSVCWSGRGEERKKEKTEKGKKREEKREKGKLGIRLGFIIFDVLAQQKFRKKSYILGLG